MDQDEVTNSFRGKCILAFGLGEDERRGQAVNSGLGLGFGAWEGGGGGFRRKCTNETLHPKRNSEMDRRGEGG